MSLVAACRHGCDYRVFPRNVLGQSFVLWLAFTLDHEAHFAPNANSIGVRRNSAPESHPHPFLQVSFSSAIWSLLLGL